MLLLQSSEAFNIKELLLGQEDISFLWEIPLRALVMFLIVLVSLRILGKRGIKQLSVFELVIILTLGSAAGDPIFYKDVGLLPALIVFIIITILYRLVTHFIDKSEKFEHLIEGKPECLIEDGIFVIETFKKEPLAEDEFFAELRIESISHLGQLKKVYIETSGDLSIYYYPDEEVKYGMPIWPELLKNKLETISKEGYYSCSICGNTKNVKPVTSLICEKCKNDKWIPSVNERRVKVILSER